MKANELRIGNWVNATVLYDKINLIVKSIVCSDKTVIFFEDCVAGEYIEDIQPIPLTESWLLRAGFETTGIGFSKNISYFKDGTEFKHLVVDINQNMVAIRCGEMKGSRALDELIAIYNGDIHGQLFLHTFQNLYFALTGTELEFKPE